MVEVVPLPESWIRLELGYGPGLCQEEGLLPLCAHLTSLVVAFWMLASWVAHWWKKLGQCWRSRNQGQRHCLLLVTLVRLLAEVRW